jgi:NAD(P)H-dependent flavin oxidoreductase YrpB (nitropropane dioxygenase family)
MAEIARARALTDKPFGVNLTIPPHLSGARPEDYIEAIVDSGVKFVETAGANLSRYFPRLKAADLSLMHKCTSVAALALGADGISMGSRFMLSTESPMHNAVKQRMLAAGERDTRLILTSIGDTTRALNNALVQQILALEKAGATSAEDLLAPAMPSTVSSSASMATSG